MASNFISGCYRFCWFCRSGNSQWQNLEEAAARLEDLVPRAALGAGGEAGGPVATAALGFPLGGRQAHLPAVVPQLSAPVQAKVRHDEQHERS